MCVTRTAHRKSNASALGFALSLAFPLALAFSVVVVFVRLPRMCDATSQLLAAGCGPNGENLETGPLAWVGFALECYFRLLNKASGPEIVDCGGSERPPPTAKPTGKCRGRSPPPFPMGFAVGRGRLDPQNRRCPARRPYCVT